MHEINSGGRTDGRTDGQAAGRQVIIGVIYHGVLSTVGMVVQRRDGPRHDDDIPWQLAGPAAISPPVVCGRTD